jgi:hypothetical protein
MIHASLRLSDDSPVKVAYHLLADARRLAQEGGTAPLSHASTCAHGHTQRHANEAMDIRTPPILGTDANRMSISVCVCVCLLLSLPLFLWCLWGPRCEQRHWRSERTVRRRWTP